MVNQYLLISLPPSSVTHTTKQLGMLWVAPSKWGVETVVLFAAALPLHCALVNNHTEQLYTHLVQSFENLNMSSFPKEQEQQIILIKSMP